MEFRKPFQQKKINGLITDLKKFIYHLQTEFSFKIEHPFNKIYLWCEKNLNDECIEYIVSMMMEPFNNIVYPLIKEMSAEEEKYFSIPANRIIADLKKILEDQYSEIIKIDFTKKERNQNFWFISKNKEEPRVANRFLNKGSELEQPLAIAREIKKLYERI